MRPAAKFWHSRAEGYEGNRGIPDHGGYLGEHHAVQYDAVNFSFYRCLEFVDGISVENIYYVHSPVAMAVCVAGDAA